MMSLFISLYRFLEYTYIGLKKDPEFRTLLFFLLLLMVSSNIFYSQHEGWSNLDSFYFSVMTMSTIGYGDLSPTTSLSKIFTIIFTFLSIGTFAALTAKFVAIVLRRTKK